jgi:multiple sugar transport system substrate-binding protein
MKRSVKSLVFLLVLCSAILISVCSGHVKRTTVVYWHFDGNPTSTPIYNELMNRFMKKNPDIEVQFVGFPASSYYQKYNIAIVTNSTPDIAGLKENECSGLLYQNVFEPLDKRLKTWKEKDNMDQKILKLARAKAPDGKLYFLPLCSTQETVWYNQKLFNRYHIQPPKTIAEFMTLCEKYADPKNGKYFFSLRGGSGSIDNLWTFLFSYAGTDQVFDAAGNCMINGPKFVKGLETYASIYWNGWTSKSSITNSFKEMVSEFGSETSMYIYHNSSSAPEHLKNLGDGNVMNAFHLTGPDGISVAKAPGFNGPGLFKTSKNKDAAWKLMTYLASAEGASYLCENEGRLPVNNGVKNYSWYRQDPFMKVYSEVAKSSKMKFADQPTWLPKWLEFRSKIQEPDFQAVLLKKKTPQEVLDRWAEILTQYQKEYLSTIKSKKK